MRWWNIEKSCHGVSNTNNSSHRETVLLHGKVFSATLIIQVNAYKASCYKLALSPGQTNEQSWIQRSTFARYNITWPLGRPYWKVLVQHFPMLEAVGPTFSHVVRSWSNIFTCWKVLVQCVLLDKALERVCFWLNNTPYYTLHWFPLKKKFLRLTCCENCVVMEESQIFVVVWGTALECKTHRHKDLTNCKQTKSCNTLCLFKTDCLRRLSRNDWGDRPIQPKPGSGKA